MEKAAEINQVGNGFEKEERSTNATSDGSISGFQSLDDLLQANLKPEVFQEVSWLLLGMNCGRPLDQLPLTEAAITLSAYHNFDLKAYSFRAEKESLREPRIVRVGLIQNSIELPTSASFLDQKNAIFQKLRPIIKAAGDSGVNILCLQEAWTMPLAFCTREKKWCEFAEPVDGDSTKFLQELAKKYNMVIVSPILERDIAHGETVWNTAVVIGNNGNVIGKHRLCCTETFQSLGTGTFPGRRNGDFKTLEKWGRRLGRQLI